MRDDRTYQTEPYMLQNPTEVVGEKCTYCMHRNDDFDCHGFCVPYDFDHYKVKEGE